MATTPTERKRIPRDPEDDYTREAAAARRDFAEEATGADLEHVGSYSFDPSVLPGNVENFTGVAQVPLGLAGPLLVNGEHAKGEFYVPLATAEGTLVASYNRGMRLLYEAGGVTTTVLDDRMQRAPAFLFADAREARRFAGWLDERFDDIRTEAEATTRSGKLIVVVVLDPLAGGLGGLAGQVLARSVACRVVEAAEQDAARRVLVDVHPADARQGRRGGGDDPARADRAAHARGRGHAVASEARLEPGRVHVGREQQRRPLRERDHRDVHRHRPGRGERGRVVGSAQLQRGAPQRRLLRVDHDPVADRGDLRRRHPDWPPSASASSCSAATAPAG